jgi:hypothetical protein
MAFEVDDLDTVVGKLRRRGVVFEEVDLPGLRPTDGIADVEGYYLSKGGKGERAAWFATAKAIYWGSPSHSAEPVQHRTEVWYAHVDRWRAGAENASAFATPPLFVRVKGGSAAAGARRMG